MVSFSFLSLHVFFFIDLLTVVHLSIMLEHYAIHYPFLEHKGVLNLEFIFC